MAVLPPAREGKRIRDAIGTLVKCKIYLRPVVWPDDRRPFAELQRKGLLPLSLRHLASRAPNDLWVYDSRHGSKLVPISVHDRLPVAPQCSRSLLAGCGASIPRAEVDRCRLGVADGNDGLSARQGAACRMVAARLVADERAPEAIGFARKACELEDGRGCDQYLALVRAQPRLAFPTSLRVRAPLARRPARGGRRVWRYRRAPDDLRSDGGTCIQDLEPRSAADAGRMFARACRLGDGSSCAQARSLGIDPRELAVASRMAPAAALTARAGPNSTPLLTAEDTSHPRRPAAMRRMRSVRVARRPSAQFERSGGHDHQSLRASSFVHVVSCTRRAHRQDALSDGDPRSRRVAQRSRARTLVRRFQRHRLRLYGRERRQELSVSINARRASRAPPPHAR